MEVDGTFAEHFLSPWPLLCLCDFIVQDQNSAGSLFKGPMFWTQYAFVPAFLRFVQNEWKANAGIFFLVYSACMNFFSLNFPLHEFFFCIFFISLPVKT